MGSLSDCSKCPSYLLQEILCSCCILRSFIRNSNDKVIPLDFKNAFLATLPWWKRSLNPRLTVPYLLTLLCKATLYSLTITFIFLQN